jgi:hypothetical protein
MQADTSLTSPIQRKQNRNYHENLSAVSFASAESNASMSGIIIFFTILL